MYGNEARTVLVNTGNKAHAIFAYDTNAVFTTKYTFFSFLPKFLWEQFSRYANLFFLIISALQQIPDISPTTKWGTIVPLGIIVSITALKEIGEDVRRRAADNLSNNSNCQTYDKEAGRWQVCRRESVRVGDLVRVEEGEEFPCDLVLLHSSDADNVCYVETVNIDGESNLKTRRTCGFQAPSNFANVGGMIVCDRPNKNIHSFNGIYVVEGKEYPIGRDNVLLRGSRMMNGDWAIGIAIYTGTDTKLVMNSQETRIKSSSIEQMTNQQIANMTIILTMMVLICIGGLFFVSAAYSYRLPFWEGLSVNLVLEKMVTFLILLYNLIPISLILTMEVIRVRIGGMIDYDVQMYCEESDTPAAAKTTSLVEELGQIDLIFSDKTGTLTQNVMELKQLFFGGRVHRINDCRGQRFADDAKFTELTRCMAICNVAFVGDESIPLQKRFQSSSPDEVAILKGAAALNCLLAHKTPKKIVIKGGEEGVVAEWRLLCVIDFDSDRKRMTVVVEGESGEKWVVVKGADSVIIPRLEQHTPSSAPSAASQLEIAVLKMSESGLRTLVYAQKAIADTQWQQWHSRWTNSRDPTSKQQLAQELECDLTLVGATGVEDLLQEDVAETIQKLDEANIKFWVLTGDKVETATNIGYSCKLLDTETALLVLDDGGEEMGYDQIKSKLANFQQEHLSSNQHRDRNASSAKKSTKSSSHIDNVCKENAAIILGSHILAIILDSPTLQSQLLQVAIYCRTVLCCRASPDQKAQVVRMVKSHFQAICLAIGDGANDVGMIQEAQVGVGISGKEGLQAARSSDFSIAKFKYLQRLLLVHGAWGYHRISTAALFSIYKNVILLCAQFWYAWVNLFSGQTVYDGWTLSLYNVVFTAWPPIVIGITDQFLNADSLLANPAMYRKGQSNQLYNQTTFWFAVVNGAGQSLLAFLVTTFLFFFGVTMADGLEVPLFFYGCTLFTSILFIVVVKASLLLSYFTFFTAFGILVCPVSWLWFVYMHDWMPAVWPTTLLGPRPITDLRGYTFKMFGSPMFWSIVLATVSICVLRDYGWKFYKRQFRPEQYHIVQEMSRTKSWIVVNDGEGEADDCQMEDIDLVDDDRSMDNHNSPLAIHKNMTNGSGVPIDANI